MKFEEWRKKEGISYWKLGKKMGINNVQNPSTNPQRWCLTSKVKRFPNPEMVKKIVEITKNKVTIKDLYDAWYETKI
jgi:hypothetical protein